MTDNKKHLIIIDGFSFFFRAYHAVRPLSRADGLPTNALYGFAQMLVKVIGDLKPDLCAVALDSPGDTFRHKLYPQYKANRSEIDPEMAAQMPYFEPLIAAFGIHSVRLNGIEADDIIATMVNHHKNTHNITIVSSDKDLMQLLGPNVQMFDTMKNRKIGPAEVEEKFGVGPDKVIEVQALIGDSSDNIPGVRSIGPKTAAQLIAEHGDLDTIYQNLNTIKRDKLRDALIENEQNARLSKQLVTLKGDVDIPHENELLHYHTSFAQAVDFLLELELNSLANRLLSLDKKNGAANNKASASKEETPIESGAACAYEMVNTSAQLDKWLKKLEASSYFAIDTETTSIDSMRAKLVGISLAVKEGEACYIPLAHRNAAETEQLDLMGESTAAPAIKQLEKSEVLAKLKPLLASPKHRKIGHNLKYDLTIFAHEGVTDISPIEDTMLMSFCLDGGKHNHGMDTLALLHLKHKTTPFKEVCGTGQKQVTFDLAPLDKATHYAAEDADITLRLYKTFMARLCSAQLNDVRNIYETVELPLVPVLARMEQVGALVDIKQLQKLSDEFATGMAKHEKKIFELAGEEFNVNSPKQLGEVLFDKMELSIGKKKTTSTNAAVLEQLADAGHEIATEVLKYRSLAKLRSTYTEALMAQVNPKTGRVHTSFNQAGAATGRFSSSDPNLQNIPIRSEDGRKIRHAFIAAPGNVLMSADYSQIELRLLAHASQTAALLDAFNQDVDVHAYTAHQIFDTPLADVTNDQRRIAKTINFGLIYGMGSTSLGKQLGISRNEAKEYIEKYFNQYDGVRAFMDSNKLFAHEHGYVKTLFGRHVHLPNISSTQPMLRAGAERAAINAPLQGANADIIKMVMPKIEHNLLKGGYKTKMILQVHDELVFEVPTAELEAVTALIKNDMQTIAKLSVPLKVDTGTGDNWEDAH